MSAQQEAIVALQATLAELADADRRLNSIPEWMQELHLEHQERKAEIDAAAAVGAEAEKEQRAAEAEISDTQEKLKHYQQQIGQVSTQREYGALLKEIDTAKSQIRDAEQQALEAIERKELAQEQHRELSDGFRELDERYQAELGKWEEEKPAVASMIEELTGRSEGLRAQVPRNMLVIFDRLYKRYEGQALARICKLEGVRGGNAMWHCEACSYSVRPQIVVDIRNGGVLSQCDSCKRILYLGPEDE